MDMSHSEHELQASVLPSSGGSGSTGSLNEASADVAHDDEGKQAAATTTAASSASGVTKDPSPPIANTIPGPNNSSPSSPTAASPSLPIGAQEQQTPRQDAAEETPNRSQQDEEALVPVTAGTVEQQHSGHDIAGTTDAGTQRNRTCRSCVRHCLCHWRTCSAFWLVLITLMVVFVLPIYIIGSDTNTGSTSAGGTTNLGRHTPMAQEYLLDHHGVFDLTNTMKNTGLVPNPKKFYDYSEGVEVPAPDGEGPPSYWVTCPLPPGVFDWVQWGDEFEGGNDYVSEYGRAVDMSDDGTVFVATQQDTRKKSGFVNVWQLRDNPRHRGRATRLGPPDYGSFGHATDAQNQPLALSGNGNVIAFVLSGVLTIYRKSGGDWHQWYSEYRSGLSLALNELGTILAVLETDGTHAYVRYVQNQDLPTQETTAPDLMTGLPISAKDGGHIAMNAQGTRIAVGTPRGNFKVFDLINERRWEQVGSYPNSSSSSYGTATRSLDLSADGTTLAVGRAHVDADRVEVWEFIKNGGGSGGGGGGEWKRKGQQLLRVSPAQNYGHSVRLNRDGSILAVGAPGGKDLKGSVFVYQYNEDCDEWFPISNSGRDDGPRNSSMMSTRDGLEDLFGQSFAMNELGNRVVIGVPRA